MHPKKQSLKHKICAPLILAGVFIFVFGVLSPVAEAAQIKRVQRGIANFDSNDVTISVPLTYAVDMTKSILLATNTVTTQTSDQNEFFTTEFEDSQTINISRAGGTVAAGVHWEVIEFEDGVSVQRGVTSMQSTGASNKIKNISIVSIDTAKVVPIIQTRAAFTNATQTHELHLLPSFTNSTTMQLERKDATGTKAISIVWQVIEFQTDVTIQTGADVIAADNAADGSSTVDINVNAVTNPLLFTYFSGGAAVNGVDDEEWTSGQYIAGAPNIVRFNRYNNTNTVGHDVYVRFYLVDFTDDASTSQSGSLAWDASPPATLTIAAAGSRTIATQANGGIQDLTPIRIKTTVNHGFATGDSVTITGAAATALTINATSGTGIKNTTPITIRTTANHGLSSGDSVTIAGTTTPTFTIDTSGNGGIANQTPIKIKTTANHGLATGSYITISANTMTSYTIATTANGGIQSTTPIRIKTTANHGYSTGARPTISGAGIAGVNGQWTITVIDNDEFTLDGTTSLGAGGGGSVATDMDGNYQITLVDADEFTLDGTYASGVGGGGTVTVRVNGSWLINSTTANEFTLNGTVASGNGNGGSVTADIASAVNKSWASITVIDADEFTLDGSTKVGPGGGGTVTGAGLSGISQGPNGYPIRINTTANHGLTTGDVVSINGAGDPVINGDWPVVVLGLTSFQLKGSDSANIAADNGAGSVQKPKTTSTLTAIVPARTIDNISTTALTALGSQTNRGADDLQIAGWLRHDISDPTATSTIYSTIRNPGTTALQSSSVYYLTELSPVTLKTPNGVEINAASLVVGTPFDITWVNAADVASHNWKLQMSVGGGAYNDLTTGCTSPAYTSSCSGSGNLSSDVISWKPPDNISNNVKLRIIDTTLTGGGLTEARSRDTSNAAFTIRGSVSGVYITDTEGTVDNSTNPLGIAKTDAVFHWAHTGSIGNVKIELDTDDDGLYGGDDSPVDVTVVASTGGTADAYTASSWAVPDNISTTLKARVKELTPPAGATVEGISSNFEIRPTITILKPDGSSIWVRGQGQTPTATNGVVRWCTGGTINNVDIRYSSNGGSSYSADTDKVINNCSTSGCSVLDGTNTANCPGALSKEYHYNWTLPGDLTISAGSAKLKIVKTGDTQENVKALSSTFETKAAVQIDLPATSTILRYQQPVNIAWSSPGGGLGNIKLMYCNGYVASGCQNAPADSDWVQITDPASATNLAPGASPFGWNVQATVGADRGLLAADMTNPTLIWHNTGPYTVKAWFGVTEPHTSELLRIGATKTITWADHGYGNQDVYICIDSDNDGDCDYNLVNAAAVVQADDQSYADWSPPDGGAVVLKDDLPRCTSCSIRVYKPGDDPIDQTGTFGKSGLFSIKGNIANVAITEAGPYKIGDVVTVTWTSAPASNWTTVRLKYSKDGSTWTDFAGTPTQASYPGSRSWTIPDDPNVVGSTIRVRVQDDADASNTYDDSDLFTVKGSLTLGALTGSPWLIGTGHDITWTKTGGSAIGNVNVKYSLDNGVSFPNLIKTVSGSSYTWCVGKNDGCSGVTGGDAAHDMSLIIGNADKNTTVKILVEDANDTFANNGTYNISPAITIQKAYTGVNVFPASRILFVDDTTQALAGIIWSTSGNTTNNVFIAYQTSGYTFPSNNIKDTPGSSDVGAYNLWTVPNDISKTVRIRVKSSADSSIYGDSADFTIKGKVDAVAPTGSSTLVIGNNYDITYAKHGSIGNLKIEYFHNSDSVVISPPSNPGPEGASGSTSYTWDWSHVLPTGFLNGSNIIDTSGTKNSKFVITGLTHIADAELIASVTTANFQVRGQIYNIKPDNAGGFDGAVFTYGTGTRYIMWKTYGNTGNVKIRLDKYSGNGANGVPDNGDEFQTQLTGPNGSYPTAESVPYNFDGDGAGSTCSATDPCWEWNVPDDMATTYRIRVESTDNPASLTNGMATFATHAANFRVRGSVTVLVPNGVQSPHWKSGEASKSITWTIGGSATTVGNVKIDMLYDLDSDTPGAPYAQTLPITSGTSSTTGSFTWNIPNNLSTDYAIMRITAVNDSTVTDDSNAEFKIKPLLAITYPNQVSDELAIGSLVNITWAAPLGDVSTVKVNVSTDGTTWNDGTPTYANKGGLITASTDAGSPFNNWSVPDIMSNTTKIRICKNLGGSPDAETCDDSGTFNIIGIISNVYVKSAVNDAAPNSPIDLPIDNEKYITWDYNGSLGNVDIYYTTNADAGTPTWTLIPDPDGGGPRTSGANVPIDDGTPGAHGSYQWKIPNAPSPNVRVKVLSVHNDAWKDIETLSCSTGADCTNSIIGSITEVSVVADGNPSTTDMEVTGSKVIRWKPNGSIALFDVEYRTAGGAWSSPPITGANGVAGTPDSDPNFLVWTWSNIPDSISNDVDFRVLDHNDPTKVSCTSFDGACNVSPTAAYIIKGKLSVASPLVTDVWTLGSTPGTSIRWNKQGTIGDLKIEYSALGDFSDTLVIESAYASGSDGNNDYAWAAGIVGANRKISDTGKIRITNVSPPAGTELTALSPTFKIRPSLTGISSPSVGVTWFAGDTNRTITWSCNSGTKADGSTPKVTLEYRVDGGTPTAISGAGNLNCNNGANNYSWPAIPNEKSDNAEVKISFNDYPTHGPLLSSLFKIYPKITVTPTPDANTKLKVGQTYANLIKWTSTGDDITDVEIRYDTNGGAGGYPGGQTIATDIPVGNGGAGVTWTNVPNIIGTNVKIKVFDKAFPQVYGESPAFKVMAGITNISPSGGSNKTANSTMSIGWDYTGTVGTFKVYYDLNSGKGPDDDPNPPNDADNWTLIDSATSASSCSGGSCSYSWVFNGPVIVPDNVLNTAAIKITNSADETDVFTSGTDFKLGAGISGLLPANGQVIDVGSNSDITWTKTKGLANTTKMKIEYTNNASAGSPSWTEITPGGGTDNDGTFTWLNVPGTLNDLNADVRLRMTQVNPDNSAVTLAGAGSPFTIRATVTVTEPVGNGTESWGLLEDHNIKFKKKGELQTVNIYYAADGVSYAATPINAAPIDVSALADDAIYTWSWDDIPANTSLTSGFSGKIKVKAETPAAQKTALAQGISGAGGFQLRGSITSVTPSGASDLIVGQPYDIVWTPVGNILKYKVEYSHVAGATPTWIEITGAGGVDGVDAGGGNKKWQWPAIANTISNNVKFRVSDYNNSSTNFVSPSVNIIKGQLSMVSPIVTDVWTIGTTASPSIRWNKTGSIGDLKIEYSVTGTFTAQDYTDGNVYTIESAYNSGADGNVDYAWSSGVIGANRKISDAGKIRITNVSPPAGTELEAISAAFKIRPAFTSLSSPASGVTWYVGDTNRIITWACNSGTKADGSTPKVTLQYRTDGGSFQSVSGAGNLNCNNGANNYTWPSVSDVKSSNVEIQVSFNDYASYNPMLSASFNVYPKITVTPTPDANTKLKVGSTNSSLIKWTYTGTTITNVDIRYSVDGGLDGYPIGQVIATDVPVANGGSGMTWSNVPNIVGTNIKVKVFDNAFSAVFGESPAFKVMAGISGISPAGGVNRTANSTNSITWNYTGNVATFKVYYDLNSGKGVDNDPNPPNDADNWTLIDSPSSASICSAGSCSYSWVFNGAVPVPDNVLNTAIIRVTNSADETDVYDVGTDYKLGAGVSNLQPTNGQVVLAGSTSTNVTWNKDKGLSNATKMKIEYTNNASAGTPTWVTITPGGGTDNTGSFLWNPIPGTLNDLKADLRLRISQQTPANSAVSINGSGTPFVVKAQITVTEPLGDGSESWPIGSNQNVKFSKKGELQTVNIYYAPDGVNYETTPINAAPIDVSALADDTVYTYSWSIPVNIPLTAGYVGRIKVRANTPTEQLTALAQGLSAASSGFKIRGSVANILPSGATDLEVGGQKQISWTASGAITKFRVFYRYNAGSWIEISPGPGVSGSNWTWNNIPNTISNDVDFRVEDYDNNDVYGESPANNLIKGKLSLVSPISSDVWTVGATASPSIRWNKTGTIGDLKIEYSASGGFAAGDYSSGYVYTIESAYASGADGNVDYAWPAGVIGANRKISDAGKIRITNLSAPAGTELEVISAAFKIRPAFTSLSSPASAVTWFAGDTNRTITWACNSGTKADGSTPKVTIQYRVDGGSFQSVSGAGSLDCNNGANNYTWPAVPADVKSNNVELQISLNDYPTYNPILSASFKIYPKIIAITPDANSKLIVDADYPNLIKWSFTGTTITNVDIRYDTNGGAGGYPPNQTIATDIPVANGAAGINWDNVPDIIGSNVKIKIFDNAFSSAFAETAPFKVMGGLVLTGPTGGITKLAATNTDITWNFSGSIANVNLYYDADTTNGVSWTSIGTKNQTGCTGSCSYTWTTGNSPAFPSAVGNNYRIRITNAADETDVYSDGTDFKIGAQFDLTAPENGSPVYAEDTSTDITWQTLKGSGVSKVRIYYSNGDLTTSAADPTTLGWILLTPSAGIANNGTYTWNPIPRSLAELNTLNHRILITQYNPDNQDQVFNVSGGAVFPILGKLIMTTPSTGSESWGVNTNQTIKFKKQGNLQSAELYYSYDGTVGNYVKMKRADNSTIVDISDATGVPDGSGNYSFSWFLDPATVNLTSGFSGKIKAKVVDPSTQTSVESLPSTSVEVKGTVTLRKPGGVDDPTPAAMNVGGTYVIGWEKFGAVNNVEIHYSTNGGIAGGGSYPDPANEIFDGASTPSTFTWDIPDKIGNQVRIRIRHKENTNVWDESDVNFRIKGGLVLTEPEAGGLSYTFGGANQTIRWTSTGTFSPLDIAYDKDGNFATTGDTYPVLPLSTVNNCTPSGTPPYQCNGTATFQIEDKISAATKVRIRGTGVNSDVEWISTNPFKIIGSLDVTAPESGQIWLVGETNRTITWDATGTITNVNLGYKTSLGSSCNYTAIASNQAGHTAGANTYNWTTGVADERSESVYLCVQDANFPEVVNAGSAPFSIRPKITVTEPVANTRLAVEGDYPNLIKFSVTGTKTTNVDVRYSLNGGTDGFPYTIASNVDVSTGPAGIAWNDIPDTLSNNVVIKVVDPLSASEVVYGLSPTPIKIVGSINVTDPPTGTYVNVGGNYLIKWTKTGSFSGVNIWYSTDGGANFNYEIDPSETAGNLQYNWTNIPATPSNNVVVRVADANDPLTKGISPLSTHIHRIYDITAPETGEVLPVGSNFDIQWTTAGGTAAHVKLQYATNGGGASGNWTDITGATDLPNTTPAVFSWAIPNAISSQVKVRVVDLDDPDNWNESGVQNNATNGIFKIRPDLRVLSPNGNSNQTLTDKLLVGSTVPISWQLNGTMSTVKLEASINGGIYTTITSPTSATNIDASTGQVGCNPSPCWNWQIPDNISQQVRVRVVNEGDTTVYDSSDYDFAIKGGFTWTYPTALGTVFKSGETKTLTWTTTGSLANINLEYSTNTGSSYSPMLNAQGQPATEITNSGSFNWVVPTNVVSKEVYLKITGYTGPTVTDPNSATLTLKDKIAGILYIDAPVGGARWGVSTTKQIKWHADGPIANIKIEHSLNGGTNWVSPAITDSVPATGQPGCTPAPCYNWSVPTTTSADVLVRLSDIITDSGTDMVPSSSFKIVGSINITAPTSSSIWPVSTPEISNPNQNITWSTQGNIAQVNVWYSANGNPPFTKINSSPIADGGAGGTLGWSVPDFIGTTAKIMIEDNADPYPNTYTLMTDPFTIRGDLKITSPVGDPDGAGPQTFEKWGVSGGVAAAKKTIFWQRNGTISQVYLDYSITGNTGPWIDIITSVTNSGNYAWDVPDTMSANATANAFIRIRNVSGPAVEYITPAPFKIMARFDLTNPDGGEIASAGAAYNPTDGITWGKWGSNATFVKIDMATDVDPLQPCSAVSAASFDKVIYSNTPNDGKQAWTPSVDHVTPAACLRIYDVNDVDSENRSASPFVIRATFNFVQPTGQDIEVGTPFDVVWTKIGNIPQVKIEYSPNNDHFVTDTRVIEGSTGGLVPNQGDSGKGDGPNTGRFVWTPPDIEDTMDTNIELRISDPNDSDAKVVSLPFRIIPKFTVTSPNGNANATLTDRLKVGHRVGATDTPYTITWDSTSSPTKTPSVVLRFSTDGGVTFPNVIGSVVTSSACAQNGSIYNCSSIWASGNGGVQDNISTQVRVQVEDDSDGIAKDKSNDNFRIISNFKLNYPNGGAVYDVGDAVTVPIAWENIGTVNNVELAYSTAGSDFTNPTVFIPTMTNSGSYDWTVADAIGSTVRVRVKSTTDDGFDISDSNFRIRGKLAVSMPTTGTRVPIGPAGYDIVWVANGTIPNVDIKYDINGGKGADNIAGNGDDYPFTIATGAPGCTIVPPALTCDGFFNWSPVPDTATSAARIKIIDSRAAESDVIGVSPGAFNIVGNFTILEPNGNEDWRVNTQHDIRFNWSGTMQRVRFFYSKNNAADPDTIPANEWILIGTQDYGAGDGSGGAVRTFTWTIPDDISPTVRVKVDFGGNPPNYNADASVKDYSDATFKIRGSFAVTSPNGNANINQAERWVTFDSKQIAWTTTGTIPQVKLEFSNDDFVSDVNQIGAGNITNCTPIPPALTCNQTYNWSVADRVMKNGANYTNATDLNGSYPGPNLIKVRVVDPNDTAVFDKSDNNFKLDYYKITWDIRDLLTNSQLSGLTVKAAKDIDEAYVIWNQSGITTNPPAVRYFPYGTWVATWSKTEYTEMAATVTADQDRDYSIAPLGPLFMQTSTVHIWSSISQVAYDPDTDKLSIVSWLERDGSKVPGPIEAFYKILDDTGTVIATLGSPTAANPKNAIIGVPPIPPALAGATWYNSSVPPDPPHEPALPNADGYFVFSLPAPSGLTSGKVYVGEAQIKIGTGGVFKTPKPFDISGPKKLQDLEDTINTVLDKPLSQVEGAIIGQMTSLIGTTQGETVKDILDAQTGAIDATLDAFEQSVQDSLTALEEGAEQSLEAGATLEATAKRFSWKTVVSPNPALSGDTVTIQAQGLPELKPIVSVFNHENKEVIAQGLMDEDPDSPGNYSYTFKVSGGNFAVGKAYTFIVSEDTTGGLAAGSGFVEAMSLTTVAGLAAAAPEAKRAAEDAFDAIKALEATISKGDVGGVKDTVAHLQKVVDELPEMINKQLNKEGSPISQVKNTVKDISEKLATLAGEDGYDFKDIFTHALSDSPDVKQIRQASDEIQSGVEVMGAIVEAKLGGNDAPIVQVSYSSGSVVLKVIAANPSDTKSQAVPIKIYLPQEATPHDILDKGDLDLSYDSDKSLYFVFKDKVILAPKEVRVFQVELEDIWFVKQDILDTLREQTEKIIERLKGTAYHDQANLIAQTIYGRLAKIAASQADESVNKELHIGIFRSNLKMIEGIKEDIARLEKLLVQVGAPPAPDLLAESKLNLKTPSKATTWFIIFAILIFIGLLGAVFFFTWQAQVRVSKELSEKGTGDMFPKMKTPGSDS